MPCAWRKGSSEMKSILLADIGGTNARLAFWQGGKLSEISVYKNKDFSSFEKLADDYLRRHALPPSHTIVSAAGQPAGDTIQLTNHAWSLCASKLRRRYGLEDCVLVNDFIAQGLGTLNIPPQELLPLGRKKRAASGNRVVIGPGTGLGVSFVFQTPDGHSVCASEAGHISAPFIPEYADLLAAYAGKQGRLSVERLAAGPALPTLYRLMNPAGLPKTPEDVIHAAAQGDKPARTVCALFFRSLAVFAGDMALAAQVSSVYLVGGILPQQQVLQALRDLPFRKWFEDKGRFSAALKKIPIFVVLRPNPAFEGLKMLAESLFGKSAKGKIVCLNGMISSKKQK